MKGTNNLLVFVPVYIVFVLTNVGCGMAMRKQCLFT